ncbi:sugar phosphate permease [Edaphobacter modestus]|uniref:Sugar phosphate permease n=2 Tax=Edaphobacter modestus TaxID=388466 RepID=A0A4V2G4W0_9BACT|nr:sugar phosphate permease [Edaphobacter modestus]
MMDRSHSVSLRRHQTVTLSLLFLAGVVNFLDRSSLSIANTTVRAEMHLSGTQMGWLLSAFSLAYGIAQLPLIGLLDRVGTRSILGGGLILWSAAQALTGIVPGFATFLVLRVLLGIGEAPFYPSGIRSTREWFSSATRGRATAIMSSSQTIGLAIAPPILTWIMLSVGWRAMFILLGVFGLIVAVAWIAFHRARRDTIFAEPEPPPVVLESAWKTLIRQRAVWGMMLGWGGVNYTVWLYLAWLPGYLQDQRHLSLARTGWVAALPFLFGALGMLSSGVISDRLARTGWPLTTVHRRNIVCGMVASAGCTFVVAYSQSTMQAVAGISMALFFIHFAGTSGWGYVQAISPLRYVASLGALQNFASFMIASAAPVLTGWLLDRTHSFTIALGICSAVTLLGALSYATLAGPEGMHLEQESPASVV